MKTKKLLLSLAFASSGLITACNQASFSSNAATVNQQCADGRPEVSCQVVCDDNGQCFKQYDYSIQAEAQVTDVLFVVDNSASMHNEQRAMSDRFSSFMSMIQNINYRIGMVTTDISSNVNPPDSNNGNGAFQDGQLLAFDDGSRFLDGSNSVSTEETLFRSNVQREETLRCANFINQPAATRDAQCPSGDERGILAAALNIDLNPSSWIRPSGHLAVVILSDEDEGSVGNSIDSQGRDEPAGFVQFVRNKFPSKSLAVHSIIIRPGDQSCLTAQTQANDIHGRPGNTYAELTNLTDGILGNICSSNYAQQLSAIGEAAAQFREVLSCDPYMGQVDVSFTPELSSNVQVTRRLEQREILFSGNIPDGTQINISYRCLQ